MKVLHVLPSIASQSGGPVRSTLASCRALHAVNPEARFTLVTTGKEIETGWRAAFEAHMPRGMKLEVFPGVGHHAFVFSPQLAGWLWRYIPKFDLLVVRTLFNPISSTAAWIARRRGVPYLVVPHGTLSRYTFEHRRTLLKRVYFQLVERRTLAGAAAIRFTSEAERGEAPVWGAATPALVIPHPHEARLTPGEPGARNPHQILFLSRFHPVKGIDVLLAALRLVLAESPAAHLVLAGSGTASFEQHVRSEIKRLELEEAVKLPGFVEGDEKARLLTESAVFALPSHHENFGIAAVEAMDAGLPVVISRGVDIWPKVEQAGAGVVVEENTPGAVAQALLRLLDDEPLRHEMGRNGQELVRSAFDPETVGRELIDLYRAVGKRQRAGSSCETP